MYRACARPLRDITRIRRFREYRYIPNSSIFIYFFISVALLSLLLLALLCDFLNNTQIFQPLLLLPLVCCPFFNLLYRICCHFATVKTTLFSIRQASITNAIILPIRHSFQQAVYFPRIPLLEITLCFSKAFAPDFCRTYPRALNQSFFGFHTTVPVEVSPFDTPL